MHVLVEAEKGSAERARFDDATLRLKSKRRLRKEYPFAYGFVHGSQGPGTDALDCFILTDRPVRIGDRVDCEPVDVFILSENDESDIKILAVQRGDGQSYDVVDCRRRIEAFLTEVFKEWPDVAISVGPLLGKSAAVEYLEEER